MKNKATLSLIEQVIMILVFALSAAISLRLFAYGDTLSMQKLEKDRAALWAQNAAECLTASSGDFDAAAELLGAERTENGMEKRLEDGGHELLLTAEETDNSDPLLGEARIAVTRGETELFTLRVCWQEG